MVLSSGFQLSLELSKVFPIGKGVEAVASQLLGYARDLRRSGSDIVVEEDLKDIFGRGRIVSELEEKFKSLVKTQNFTVLHKGCEVRLDSGPGPTMIHALQNHRQLSTIIQLSFLSWMHSRDELAIALAGAMTKRFAMNVQGASPDPGFDGILGTLTTCSSQSSAFAWSEYVQLVDAKLGAAIPDYRHRKELLSLTPGLLLGAMDYMFLVQQLPEDRKITVSSAIGAITLTIWAHYILGLNVLISVDGRPVVEFGNREHPHMLISWSQITGAFLPLPERYATQTSDEEPKIRLLDRDMSIVLEVPPELERWTRIESEDRHPLSNYGAVYLHRAFNADTITSASDPIYKETVCLATAAAIRASRNLKRECGFSSVFTETEEGVPPRLVYVEIWRVLEAAKLVFSVLGNHFDTAKIESYVSYLSEYPLDESSLPNGCTADLKKAQAKALKSRETKVVERYIHHVFSLATTILIFAHVDGIHNCGEMPVLLQTYDTSIGYKLKAVCEDPENPDVYIEITPEQIFKEVIQYLNKKALFIDERCFLMSYFGWSVFLDTIGDKDPGDIKLGLFHVHRGTPTNVRTGERKLMLADNRAQATWNPYPENVTRLIRGRDYLPRAAAKVDTREEYWSTTPTEFSLSIQYLMRPEPEWREHFGTPYNFLTELTSYREMYRLLWLTFSTTACGHAPIPRLVPVKLGPDAAIVLGWRNEFETRKEPLPERILILLTRGEPGIRWLAIKHALNESRGAKRMNLRLVMLRTASCCDTCALEQATAQPGKWILIL